LNRRVVITGLGAITPLGNDVETFWHNLSAGVSGISHVDAFDASEYPAKIAGQVRGFNPELYGIDRKDARKFDRFAQFAIAAAKQAIEDANLDINEDTADDIGVYIGSGIGGIGTMLDNYRVLMERGPKRVSPLVVPMMIGNIGAGLVSIMFGAKGPNSAPVSACATGTHAIGDAYKMIQRGAAEAMIAGGAEAAICDLALAGFGNMKALSTRNDEPTKASRPFELNRDGFVMGEGAGVVILESLDYALARGARIYAEIIGYGMSGDAYHVTAPAPEGDGAFRAMRQSMQDANLTPEQLSYINAHGTSTDFNDRFETLAVKKLLGDYAYQVPISSNKSMTGHLLGAAGGVEAIASILTMQNSLLPPTINYDEPDPDCDLDYVPNIARPADVETVMSNSFGFGGHNASIILKRYTS